MAKKDQKYYPVQNRVFFNNPVGTGMRILQVNKALSGTNRRLYRQNRVYSVKVDAVGNGNMLLDVYRLRDTFMLQRGYGLAMREWNESYDNAEEVTKESNIARWRDFRIATIPTVGDTECAPVTMRASGANAVLDTVQIDKWNTALSYTTAGASRDFGLFSDANTFGIIEEYDKQGVVQRQPSTATVSAAYEDLKADLDDNEVSNLQLSGNEPPYDADSSTPNSVLEYVGTVFIDNTAGTQKMSTGYFDAPLGVVFVSGTAGRVQTVRNASDTSAQQDFYQVTVQRGDYKGVKAHEYVSPQETTTLKVSKKSAKMLKKSLR